MPDPTPARPLCVLQVLPALDSGGVERGTVDFARTLVSEGHRSLVMSAGGRLEAQLQREGSQCIRFPVHKKSLLSLRHVPALRREILALAPDIVHVRSRMPAWLIWLALKKLPATRRPALVSTFHGMYSVNRYSEIMGCGERVIAISECVREYILDNYPRIDPAKITVIHRGVDTEAFSPGYRPTGAWRERFYREHPTAKNQHLLTMAGRLSRWKGQEQFIDLIARLRQRQLPVHGLIVGDITPGKTRYRQALKERVRAAGLEQHVSFLGHRGDVAELYAESAITYNLSQKPEPFGRTVIESLAVGTPVIAWDRGGPAESLRASLPDGLIAEGDTEQLAHTSQRFLAQPPPVNLNPEFTLATQAHKTLALYHQLAEPRPRGHHGG